MSIKEANRLGIMQQIDKKILSLQKASEELGVSLRQAKRIRKRYLSDGELGLISKHRGKVSPNRIKPKLKADVLRILRREEYAGFGPTFAKEKLQQRNGYYLSDEMLRQWMIEARRVETSKMFNSAFGSMSFVAPVAPPFSHFSSLSKSLGKSVLYAYLEGLFPLFKAYHIRDINKMGAVFQGVAFCLQDFGLHRGKCD